MLGVRSPYSRHRHHALREIGGVGRAGIWVVVGPGQNPGSCLKRGGARSKRPLYCNVYASLSCRYTGLDIARCGVVGGCVGTSTRWLEPQEAPEHRHGQMDRCAPRPCRCRDRVGVGAGRVPTHPQWIPHNNHGRPNGPRLRRHDQTTSTPTCAPPTASAPSTPTPGPQDPPTLTTSNRLSE